MPLRLFCFFHWTLLIVVAAGLAGPLPGAETKPNIVILLADDLGWNGVSYHGNFARTPNIDQLIHSGVELDRFYVAPMCSPTRAGLLTGRYPIRFGLARAVIPPQRNYGLPVSELTLPEALARAGYQRRGVFGKWHLGHHDIRWHPLRQGFTHFEGHYNGAIDYFELTREGERDWHQGLVPSDRRGYATDLIADAAARFISESAPGEAPYFCYVPFNAPHSPFQAKPEDLPGDFQNRKPAKIDTFKAMIDSMDQGIGRILKAIEESGEADQTQVWFFSDNGGVKHFPANNRPLRGSKLTTFEGGIRVPAGVRWPAKWKAGRKLETVCGYIDVMPTILASAGLVPDRVEHPQRKFDGVSLLELLNGQQETLPERDWYSYHGQGGLEKETIAVRNRQWKLVVNGPSLQNPLRSDQHEVHLFEIGIDPQEKKNVAGTREKVVAELWKKLVTYRALQPPNGVPVYGKGKQGFQPWKNWDIRR